MEEQKKFSTNDEEWYVLRTRSRYEKKLAEQFDRMGVDYYLPLKTERKKWSDRWKNVESPLFPGFIFVQMIEENRFEILNTPGAVQFLYFDKEYAKLTRRDVYMINYAVSGKQELEVVESGLVVGSEVKITSGPFKGFDAKLVHHNGKGKLMLEVHAIAQGVMIEIGNAEIIEKQKR